MWRSILLAMIAVLVVPCNLAAEEVEKPSFWDRIHLRHNLDTKKEVARPGFVQVTDPDGEESSYAVGLGLKIDAYASDRFSIGPFVEYQKNTLIDKEQDILKGGLVLDWQVHCIDPSGQACDGRSKDHGGFLFAKANYMRDNEKNKELTQLAATYTHAWVGGGSSGGRKFPHPNLYFPAGKNKARPAFGLLYSPAFGVELDEVTSADDSGMEGTILRGVFSLSVRVWPAPTALNDRLEINALYVYRDDLSDSTAASDDSHPLFVGSISYTLLKGKSPDRKVAIALAYTDGEDPSEGFEDQSYWKFGLTFQVD